jgi:hypothetical protein
LWDIAKLSMKLNKDNTRSPCLPDSWNEIAKTTSTKLTWGQWGLKHKKIILDLGWIEFIPSWGWELIFPQKYVQKVRIGLKPHFPVTGTNFKGSSCLCHLIISSTKFWKYCIPNLVLAPVSYDMGKKYITELPLADVCYDLQMWVMMGLLCKNNEYMIHAGCTISSCTLLEHPHRCSICYPAKIFLTSKFSYLHFCNPTDKTELGIANRWETTNSKPRGPIMMIGQSKIGNSNRSIFITLLSSRCTPLLRYLPASGNSAQMQEKNQFLELNLHMLIFLHPILMCSVTYWALVGMLLVWLWFILVRSWMRSQLFILFRWAIFI